MREERKGGIDRGVVSRLILPLWLRRMRYQASRIILLFLVYYVLDLTLLRFAFMEHCTNVFLSL